MQVVTLLFWQCARGGRNLFASPDANAKGGMLHDDGQRLSTVHPDRRDSRGHVYDLMGDLSGDPQQ